jgi:hypothetical protein
MFRIITIFADGRHAWGKVSKKELNDLGLLDKISACSYQTKKFVYLEEDLDLGIYTNALINNDVKFQFVTKYCKNNKRSHIRNYQGYSIN